MVDKCKKFFRECLSKLNTFWSWYKGLYKGKPVWRKILNGFLSFIVLLFLYLPFYKSSLLTTAYI